MADCLDFFFFPPICIFCFSVSSQDQIPSARHTGIWAFMAGRPLRLTVNISGRDRVRHRVLALAEFARVALGCISASSHLQHFSISALHSFCLVCPFLFLLLFIILYLLYFIYFKERFTTFLFSTKCRTYFLPSSVRYIFDFCSDNLLDTTSVITQFGF